MSDFRMTWCSGLVLAMLLIAGCATVTSPPWPDPVRLAGSHPIMIDPAAIHFGKGFGREAPQAQDLFLATMGRLVPARDAASGESGSVRDLQIDISYSRSGAGSVFVGIFSTFVPFMPLKRSRRSAQCHIQYVLEDAQGGNKSFVFDDPIVGTYRGWSWMRIISSSHLKAALRTQAVENAAKLLVADLSAKYSGATPVFQNASDVAATPVTRNKKTRHREAKSAPVPAATSVVARASEPAAKEPPLCAIITFEAKPGIGREDVLRLRNKLEDEFDKKSQYKISDRLDMPQVLRAGEIVPASSLDVAIETGKALKVQYVIYGAVSKIGRVVTVDAYLVNVEKGITESKVSLDGEGDNAQVLLNTMGDVAKRLSDSVRATSVPASDGKQIRDGGK